MDSTGEEALDGAEERTVRPERPSKRERLLSALPLAFVLLLFALLTGFAPRFQELFEEMELGDLPRPTHFWMTIFLHPAFPFVFGPLMFAAAFLHFAWACRERERMHRARRITFFVGMLLVAGIAISFFLPLIAIMEKIGGGAR